MEHKNRHGGFTLIEMVVVISIIGIVLGMVSRPNIQALERSRDAALMMEVGHLRAAVHRFALDHGGDFPTHLEDLAPVYLREVPGQWRGARSLGDYGFDPKTGQISLLEKSGLIPNKTPDSRGQAYASY